MLWFHVPPTLEDFSKIVKLVTPASKRRLAWPMPEKPPPIISICGTITAQIRSSYCIAKFVLYSPSPSSLWAGPACPQWCTSTLAGPALAGAPRTCRWPPGSPTRGGTPRRSTPGESSRRAWPPPPTSTWTTATTTAMSPAESRSCNPFLLITLHLCTLLAAYLMSGWLFILYLQICCYVNTQVYQEPWYILYTRELEPVACTVYVYCIILQFCHQVPYTLIE